MRSAFALLNNFTQPIDWKRFVARPHAVVQVDGKMTQGGIPCEKAHFEVVGQNMPWLDWYNSLTKPGWPPTPGTIGLIWQIPFPVILTSFGFVLLQAIRNKISQDDRGTIRHQSHVKPHLPSDPIRNTQPAAGCQRAARDLLNCSANLSRIRGAACRHDRCLVAGQLLYFAWVVRATVSQLSITTMPWRRS
ncbi:MAG: tryptophan-rich sensory protein [Planctomycetaceae bacterium]